MQVFLQLVKYHGGFRMFKTAFSTAKPEKKKKIVVYCFIKHITYTFTAADELGKRLE